MVLKPPSKCCDVGTYAHCISMPIKGRVQDIDFCIADIVAALNAANITTDASCCGHGEWPGSIILTDGREVIVCRNPDERNRVCALVKRMRKKKKKGV